jgi:transketolase
MNDRSKQAEFIKAKTLEAKRKVLDMVLRAELGHISSAFSCAEIVSTLYYAVMRVDPDDPDRDNRDRFVMSKNHGSVMQYPVLADLGFFDKALLESYGTGGATLSCHSHTVVPGIDFSGGSLGIGLGVAAGMAYAGKIDGRGHLVFSVVGDAELYEGSIWETAMFAAHNRLDNLVMVVDRNTLGSTFPTEEMLKLDPIAGKWAAFGWETRVVDGHDVEKLLDVFSDVRQRDNGKPLAVVANTVKGKGIGYMENALFWHSAIPRGEKAGIARAQLDEGGRP